MSFERYFRFYDGGEEGCTLRPKGGRATFTFHAEPKKDVRYRLFTVGETAQYYMWKDEPDGPHGYRAIADALDRTHALRDRFCLNLSSKKEETYTRRVYKKVMWPPVLSYLGMNPVPEGWRVGLVASAKELRVAEGGFVQLRVDIRLNKPGVSRHSVAGEPDQRILLPIPAGSYTAKRLEKEITIPCDAAHVGVFVEGKGYAGELYVEQPFLSADGQNLLPCFDQDVADKEKFSWTGQFLSQKEWPVFRVRLNGKTVFSGEVFERSHRYSEWEIALPARLLREENTLTYELLSDYHDPLPYTVYEAGLIEQPDAPVSILSVSAVAPAGGFARVLLRTAKPNTRVRVASLCQALGGEGEYLFKEKGLHGLCLPCLAPAAHAAFTVSAGSTVQRGEVEGILEKQDDGVITGSGDMIYVCQKQEDMEEYLSWYLSEQVGDLVTVRPAYRWSGTRTLNRPLWRWFARLMDELRLKYVLMVDGREMPGLAAQPTNEEMAGAGYLGRQDHERDNAQFYGGVNKFVTPTAEQAANLMQFGWQEDPAHVRGSCNDHAYLCKGESLFGMTDRDRPRDTVACHDQVVSQLKETITEGATRHTGPSCCFKYMHEGGYDWLGAETMYSTMEPLLGFLRGFAKDQAMPAWGVHHAVQWSSSPHAAPEHARRLRLALYSSYMLGATDINTEEGYWHMEEYYEHHHRFVPVCINHLRHQQDFYRYISSHTRTGRFHTPYAFLHGRDDGINFFNPDMTWGILEKQTLAEDSWGLLKTVYPQAKTGSCIYLHGCPTDRPLGFHTSTPYGNADIIPVEAKKETLGDYRALIFLGYNRMTGADADKLLSCVENGATLLLSRAHLSDNTSIEAIRRGELTFAPSALSFAMGEPTFCEAHLGGLALSLCQNAAPADEVLLRTDEGQPLLCRYRVGKGSLLLFQTKEYPAQKALRPAYERAVLSLVGDAVAAEPVWAETGDDVSFTAYRQEDGSTHLYFLAVDWYRPEEKTRTATLRLGQTAYPVSMPFGVMLKCVTDGTRAAWATSEQGEVLSVSSTGIRVQGTGKVTFCIAENGSTRTETIDFSEKNVQVV